MARLSVTSFGGTDLVRSSYTLLLALLLMALETVFMALSTGYLFIQFRSPVFENLAFFVELARDDLLTTLRFVLVENPWLIIQSQHNPASSNVVWSLHYYSLTLLIHLGLAWVLMELYRRHGPHIKYEARFIGGVLLLTLSSLYLFLGSCCSGGPNWIVQTWLLAIVFNPVTSTNATIKLYQAIKDGFLPIQLLFGGGGATLLYHYYRISGR